jgi:hypothetical protein
MVKKLKVKTVKTLQNYRIIGINTAVNKMTFIYATLIVQFAHVTQRAELYRELCKTPLLVIPAKAGI